MLPFNLLFFHSIFLNLIKHNVNQKRICTKVFDLMEIYTLFVLFNKISSLFELRKKKQQQQQQKMLPAMWIINKFDISYLGG